MSLFCSVLGEVEWNEEDMSLRESSCLLLLSVLPYNNVSRVKSNPQDVGTQHTPGMQLYGTYWYGKSKNSCLFPSCQHRMILVMPYSYTCSAKGVKLKIILPKTKLWPLV